jgi:hypothetical protein
VVGCLGRYDDVNERSCHVHHPAGVKALRTEPT